MIGWTAHRGLVSACVGRIRAGRVRDVLRFSCRAQIERAAAGIGRQTVVGSAKQVVLPVGIVLVEIFGVGIDDVRASGIPSLHHRIEQQYAVAAGAVFHAGGTFFRPNDTIVECRLGWINNTRYKIHRLCKGAMVNRRGSPEHPKPAAVVGKNVVGQAGRSVPVHHHAPAPVAVQEAVFHNPGAVVQHQAAAAVFHLIDGNCRPIAPETDFVKVGRGVLYISAAAAWGGVGRKLALAQSEAATRQEQAAAVVLGCIALYAEVFQNNPGLRQTKSATAALIHHQGAY